MADSSHSFCFFFLRIFRRWCCHVLNSYLPVKQRSPSTWNVLPVVRSFLFKAIKRPRLLSHTLWRELDGAARQLIWLFCAPLSRGIPPQLTFRPCHMLFSPPPDHCSCSRWKPNSWWDPASLLSSVRLNKRHFSLSAVFADEDASAAVVKYAIYFQVEIGITHTM